MSKEQRQQQQAPPKDVGLEAVIPKVPGTYSSTPMPAWKEWKAAVENTPAGEPFPEMPSLKLLLSEYDWYVLNTAYKGLSTTPAWAVAGTAAGCASIKLLVPKGRPWIKLAAGFSPLFFVGSLAAAGLVQISKFRNLIRTVPDSPLNSQFWWTAALAQDKGQMIFNNPMEPWAPVVASGFPDVVEDHLIEIDDPDASSKH